MKLFEIDENGEVKVNSPWIKLVPELKELFHTTKKIPYDRNTYGRKILTYIYFYRDFSSPLRDWEDTVRHKESLKYSELEESDVSSDKVQRALKCYMHIQYESCRALKTYEASMKGLEAMDTYLKDVNFTKTDKQGKLLYTPNQYVANLALINKAYEELRKLSSTVQHELSQTTGIRGKATIGDKEMASSEDSQVAWDESVITPDGRTQWTELGELVRDSKQKKDVA